MAKTTEINSLTTGSTINEKPWYKSQATYLFAALTLLVWWSKLNDSITQDRNKIQLQMSLDQHEYDRKIAYKYPMKSWDMVSKIVDNAWIPYRGNVIRDIKALNDILYSWIEGVENWAINNLQAWDTLLLPKYIGEKVPWAIPWTAHDAIPTTSE